MKRVELKAYRRDSPYILWTIDARCPGGETMRISLSEKELVHVEDAVIVDVLAKNLCAKIEEYCSVSLKDVRTALWVILSDTYSTFSTVDFPVYNSLYSEYGEADEAQTLSTKSMKLPGMSHRVGKCPVIPHTLYSCTKSRDTRTMIIHLNDHHKWPREKIADWLDELHDAGIIDIEFKVDMSGED